MFLHIQALPLRLFHLSPDPLLVFVELLLLLADAAIMLQVARRRRITGNTRKARDTAGRAARNTVVRAPCAGDEASSDGGPDALDEAA